MLFNVDPVAPLRFAPGSALRSIHELLESKVDVPSVDINNDPDGED